MTTMYDARQHTLTSRALELLERAGAEGVDEDELATKLYAETSPDAIRRLRSLLHGAKQHHALKVEARQARYYILTRYG